MENKRFRNHWTSVVEQFGAALIALVVIIMGSPDDIIDMIVDISRGGFSVETVYVVFILLIFIVIIAIFVAWRFRVWYKTWIVIDNDTLSVERNTIISLKNTIGFKNISNVNMEQNLFEMLIGTCKVKFDTDSLSTANTTDVKIILKKKEAEELRNYIIKHINRIKGDGDDVVEQEILNNEDYDVVANKRNIIMNGLYSISILGIIIFIVSIGSIVSIIPKFVAAGFDGDGFRVLVVAITVAFSLALGTGAGFVKNFLKLYDFKLKRKNNKIYIKHGLFKKVNFAIPVNRINAIIVHQTFIARLLKKYAVEIVNVGMGDEKQEQTYFTFYDTWENTEKIMKRLLPEFSESFSCKTERQPKSVWVIKMLKIIVKYIICMVAFCVCNIVLGIPLIIEIGVLAAIMLWIIVCNILSYKTEGSYIGNSQIKVKSGIFGTTTTIIKFEKIQIVTFNWNILENKLGITKGFIRILAAISNAGHKIPYMSAEKTELIKDKLCISSFKD